MRIHGSAARTAAAAGPRGGGAGGAHRWHSTSIIVQSETRRRARPAGGKRIVLVKQIGLWAAVPRDNERNAPPGCWISSQVRRTGNANGRHMPVKTRIGQAPLLVASTVALWLVPLAEPAAQLHDRCKERPRADHPPPSHTSLLPKELQSKIEDNQIDQTMRDAPQGSMPADCRPGKHRPYTKRGTTAHRMSRAVRPCHSCTGTGLTPPTFCTGAQRREVARGMTSANARHRAGSLL